MKIVNKYVTTQVHGSKVQRFKVPFSSLDHIWDAYLREKRRFRQA